MLMSPVWTRTSPSGTALRAASRECVSPMHTTRTRPRVAGSARAFWRAAGLGPEGTIRVTACHPQEKHAGFSV